MAARKFKFVSPGVFLKEIDNSQIPKLPGAIGPVIIGRTRRGPAMKPITVDSYADFTELFGEPIAGNEGDDVWRDGNGLLAPAYAHYGAKGYFSADIESPVTMVRLLGIQGDDMIADSGEAGWEATKAFGLFFAPSGSDDSVLANSKLGAVIYSEDTTFAVAVKGLDNVNAGTATTAGIGAAAGKVVRPAADKTYELFLTCSSATRSVKVSFREGKDYIRDVLNTNPVLTNGEVAYAANSMADKYWLGETFDDAILAMASPIAFLVELKDDSSGMQMQNRKFEACTATSGWVFGQDTGLAENYDPQKIDKLFRIHSLHEGINFSKKYVVCIEDIKIQPEGSIDPYGSFTVSVKAMMGSRLETVETFAGCNLNPRSENYIGRQIGDQYLSWNVQEKRNRAYGNFPNQSRYVRVEVESDVEAGLANKVLVPFGYYGPIIPADIGVTVGNDGNAAIASKPWVADRTISLGNGNHVGAHAMQWPSLPTVKSGSLRGTTYFGGTPYKVTAAGELTDQVNPAYVDYVRKLPVGIGGRQSGIPGTTSFANVGDTAAGMKFSYIFSLDEMVVEGSNLTDSGTAKVTSVYYLSGSRRGSDSAAATGTVTFTGAQVDNQTIVITDAAGTARSYLAAGGNDAGSLQYHKAHGSQAAGLAAAIAHSNGHNGTITTAVDGNKITLTNTVKGTAGNVNITGTAANATFTGMSGGKDKVTASYTAPTANSSSVLLELGFDKFSMPLVGGFDGVDEREADPFNNRALAGKNSSNSYAFASVERAIELIRDPEAIEHNMAIMPGITNESLTTKLIQTCEDRADSLAIIDLPGVYKPPHEKKCKAFEDRLTTTPTNAAKALAKRQINSSYGATYYPWVKIRDTENTRDIWCPPSVIALGIMAYTEERDEVWFAPAGFNRGGLNEGNAGLPVLQVTEQLLSKQRDALYDANINPIASFVTEGLVVFGQKTLQSSQSALDRINVRRLMIFVKKEISRIASNLLFDQNVPATWVRFSSQVVPFLESVKTRLGLSDFKVILDDTTTTPDLIDRNIMYAKIFLKPARAIEFIAVDFVITNTGASFDD